MDIIDRLDKINNPKYNLIDLVDKKICITTSNYETLNELVEKGKLLGIAFSTDINGVFSNYLIDTALIVIKSDYGKCIYRFNYCSKSWYEKEGYESIDYSQIE